MQSGTDGMRLVAGRGKARLMGRIGVGPRPQRFASTLTVFVASIAMGIAIGAVPAQAEPMPNGVPGSWALVLNEEFSANGLNTALWTPEWPAGAVSGECTLPSLVSQPGNGYLYLQVRAQESTCSGIKNADTGSLIESNPADGKPGHSGFQYSYGYVEWRAWVPGVAPKGLACPKGGCLPDWPALWSLSNTNSNEIDTLEGLNTLGEACYHIHPPPGSEGPGGCLNTGYAGAWHTFGSEWEPGVVKVFYDGTQVGEVKQAGINATPQYLIATMVPPGVNQPLVVPDEMTIDYVRVWQHPPPPPPPTVSTSPPSAVQEEEATLNGEVNGNGVNTTYHFQYGESETPSWSTPNIEVGSGASNPIFTVELKPSTTYYYRIVAVSGAGEKMGGWQSFITPAAPSEARGPEGNLYVAAEGPNHSLYVTVREGSTDLWHGPYAIDGAGTTYSKPAEVFGAEGNLFVVAKGPNNSLYVTSRSSSTDEWFGPYQIAGSNTTYSTPAVVRGSEGNIFVAAEGPSNSLYITARSNVTYAWEGPYEIDHANTTYSAPAEAVGPEGNVFVAARGPSNSLYVTARNHTTYAWEGPYEIDHANTTYSAPAETVGSEGNVFIAAQGASNSLWVTARNHTTYAWEGPYEIGHVNTTYSTPAETIGAEGNVFVATEGPSSRLYVTARNHTTYAWEGPYEIAHASTTYSGLAEAIGAEGNIFVAGEGPNTSLAVTARNNVTYGWEGPYEIDGAGTTF
jgi:hypothetical protein